MLNFRLIRFFSCFSSSPKSSISAVRQDAWVCSNLHCPIAFVSCGQGIARVPFSLRKLAPENVIGRQLKEHIRVVTTAMAWSATGDNALVRAILSDLGITDQTKPSVPGQLMAATRMASARP